jgi:hypothetical protein
LAGASGAGHGALSASGRCRYHGAHRLCPAERGSRPAICYRKSRRRRRHDWRRGGREGGAGRLHILHDATAFSVNGSLYSNLPFDYRKDFDPVFLVALVPNILVITPTVPANTVSDVIALAKATPGGIDMASSGNGTLQHLLLELFRQRTGITINHVPYRGGGLALTDVIAGQAKFFFANGSSAFGLIKGGKVKAVAHTGKGRLASLPDIPPMSTRCRASKATTGTACLSRTARPPRS